MAHQPVEVRVDHSHKQLSIHVDVPEWRLGFQDFQLSVALARERHAVLESLILCLEQELQED